MAHSNKSVEDPEKEYNPVNYIPHSESHGTKEVWMGFWILLGLTLIDIAFYFIMPANMLRNSIFIVLGVVKAYYIVGTFMHLKYENNKLMLSIIIPIVFILWLIVLLLYEGDALSIME
jgi:caa(3)-type oxidase subunit IV